MNVNSASREITVISASRGSLLRSPRAAFAPPKEPPTTNTRLRPVFIVVQKSNLRLKYTLSFFAICPKNVVSCFPVKMFAPAAALSLSDKR